MTGTVTTNFFRTKYSLTYQLAYEEPEVKFAVPSIDIDVDFFDFLGTYADIYDSANTLEANAAPSTVLITGYKGSETVFGAGLALDELAFEERTPRNRVYCPDAYGTGSIILTFVPASYSQFGVDTIYMESEDFPNAIYTRTGYEYTFGDGSSDYDSGNTYFDPNSGLYWDDIYGMMNYAADYYMSNDYAKYTYGIENFNIFYNTGGSFYAENPIASYDASRDLYQIYFTLIISDPGRGYSWDIERSIISIWRDGNDDTWYLQEIEQVW